MSMNALIREIETEFPRDQFLWTLSLNHTGRYFANIYPRSLPEIGKGPDNGSFSIRSPQTALRTALNNARKNGVGRHLYGKR